MSTDTSPAAQSAVNGIRTFLGLSGLVALIIGILILVWPGHAAQAITAILAIYAIVAGIVYAGLAIFVKEMGGWSRVGHVVLGILFIVAGIIALTNLAATTVAVATIVAIFIGVSWLVEGIVSLTNLGGARSKGWTIFFAIVSIIAGIFVIIAPFWAATVLWLYLGIALVVLGIIQIVRAFTFANKQ